VADAVYIVKAEALTDAVTWVPDLPASGTYQVYAKWTADETRATDARYAIVHEGGTAEVSVNQRAAGGLWQYLGSYAFDPLNTPTVSLAANDNGSVAADAVRFVGGPGGAIDIAYLHSDHLGTPQAMTDANAQVLWWRDQTPFGQTVAEGGFSVSPLRFPGQYADAESGLAYNYFRDYDPALGRYIQSDPIGLRGGLNTYGYVGGNPLTRVDPFGKLTVYVWRFRGKDEAWGHASIKLENGTYISWWPGHPRSLKIPGSDIYCAPPLSRTLEDDTADEGQEPDTKITIDGLNEDAIQKWWDEFKNSNPWCTLTQNCSTTAAEALNEGGGELYALMGKYRPNNPVWTPSDVEDYANAINRGMDNLKSLSESTK
jgi:RHS repeat-associated protein